MTDTKEKELERITKLIDEAETPHKKMAALGQISNHIKLSLSENEDLVRDLGPVALKKKQEEMATRLDMWDEEAREILERVITDPEVLKAALDNTRYKDEVIAMAGTPFSRLSDDMEPPLLVKKADHVLAQAAEERAHWARIERKSMVLRLVLIIGVTGLILWGLINNG